MLLKNKAEVTHMLLMEYGEKEYLRDECREARREGREEGNHQ